jgi:alpha-mannosidase
LLCQFHDVLPGSGIGMIYEDAEERYANVQELGREVLESAYVVLYPGSAILQAACSDLIAVNTLPVPRLEVMEVDPKLRFDMQRGSEAGYVLVDAQSGSGAPKAMNGSVESVKGESAPNVANLSRAKRGIVCHE